MKEYNILIIEDDPVHLKIIKELIEEIKSPLIRIYGENRGIEALNLLKYNFNFHLIIIDIALHETNGITLAKYIKNSGFFKNTYVLMLSSSKNKADIDKAKKVGANAYLIKPIDLSEENRKEFRKIISNIKKGKEKNRGFKIYDIQ